jgi:hypothetical protein
MNQNRRKQRLRVVADQKQQFHHRRHYRHHPKMHSDIHILSRETSHCVYPWEGIKHGIVEERNRLSLLLVMKQVVTINTNSNDKLLHRHRRL